MAHTYMAVHVMEKKTGLIKLDNLLSLFQGPVQMLELLFYNGTSAFNSGQGSSRAL